MRFGSLFSGIGGFDLGLERAGMQCAWQVEIDPHCQKLLENRFPNAKRFTDVRNVGRANLESVDLICGGFPCQDLSVAGKRAGLAGKRSGLWHEFHRIVAETKPRWVVIENVPGLLSSNSGRDFAVVLRGLVECGYGVSWRILDARYFGVAQRRRRVFIVASLGNGRCAEVLFESEGVSRDSAESGETREGFAPIAGTLSANCGGTNRPAGNANELDFCIPTMDTGWDLQRARIHDASGIAPTLSQCDGKGGQRTVNVAIARCLTSRNERNDFETENLIAFSADRDGMGATENLSPTMRHGGSDPSAHNAFKKMAIAFDYQIQGSERTQIVRTGGNYAQLQAGRPDAIYWDLAQETSKTHRTKPQSKLSYTLNGLGQMMTGVRRLTPTECERLQGFPDGWTGDFSDSTRYRMLGNAVCVNVAEWIARRIAVMELA